MINRIQVTGVYVSDQNKAYEFYVNKLGLKVKTDMQMPQFRWLEVIPEGGETSLSLSMPWPGQTGVVGRSTGIIFDTSDIEKAHADLKAKGVKFTQEPTPQPWGGIQAEIADPDGNTFALVQRTDGGQ